MLETQYIEPEVELIAYSQGHVDLPELRTITSGLRNRGDVSLAEEVEKLSIMGPTELVTYSAKSCRSKLTSTQIYQDDLREWLEDLEFENPFFFSHDDLLKIRKKLNETNEHMLGVTVGSGHLAVLDQAWYTFGLKNVTRETTLFLCAYHYMSHMQQSLRAVEMPDPYIPKSIRRTKFEPRLRKAFDDDRKLYKKMVESGIEPEDARFISTLDTTTNVQSTLNARELTYVDLVTQKQDVPAVIKEVVEEMVKKAMFVSPGLFQNRGPNYDILRYYPASQIFGGKNENMRMLIEKYGKSKEPVLLGFYRVELENLKEHIEKRELPELANLKHIHSTFLTAESLVCFHQSTRQRTWDHSVEPLNQALKRLDYVIPPKIATSGFAEEFKESIEKKYKLRSEMLKEGFKPSEVNGIVAHAHVVYVLIHPNGWNIIYSFPIRDCDHVQWEISGVTKGMIKRINEVYPELGYFAQSNCRRFGYCHERRPCKNKDIYLKAFRERNS
jgi:thymidylate synthase (FAD)